MKKIILGFVAVCWTSCFFVCGETTDSKREAQFWDTLGAWLEETAPIMEKWEEEGTEFIDAAFFVGKNDLLGLVDYLENGGNPDKGHPRTPLNESIKHANLEAFNLLIQYGANIDKRDDLGYTPYMAIHIELAKEVNKLYNGTFNQEKTSTLNRIFNILDDMQVRYSRRDEVRIKSQKMAIGWATYELATERGMILIEVDCLFNAVVMQDDVFMLNRHDERLRLLRSLDNFLNATNTVLSLNIYAHAEYAKSLLIQKGRSEKIRMFVRAEFPDKILPEHLKGSVMYLPSSAGEP